MKALKGKKGQWVKPGNGGSYRGYQYVRSAPSDYPTTSQQKTIGDRGRQMSGCKGKTGSSFKKCRHAVLTGGSPV